MLDPLSRDRVCETCGVAFVMRNPSGKARRGLSNEGRFCSRACAGASHRIYATKAEAKRAERARARARNGLPAIEPRNCRHCGKVFRPKQATSSLCSDSCREADRKQAAVARHVSVERTCRECGTKFTPTYGDKRRVYCGDECHLAVDRRISHSRRRANEAGVAVRSFDPLDILKRDGWCCYLCGVDTPEDLRGTWHPQAPEIDHIVPLARGGEHSAANTACCCRNCNYTKGASEPDTGNDWARRPLECV